MSVGYISLIGGDSITVMHSLMNYLITDTHIFLLKSLVIYIEQIYLMNRNHFISPVYKGQSTLVTNGVANSLMLPVHNVAGMLGLYPNHHR